MSEPSNPSIVTAVPIAHSVVFELVSWRQVAERACQLTRSTTHQLESARYKRSIGPNREDFWAEQAQSLCWMKSFTRMVHEDFQTGDFHWFEVGTLYVYDNCVDRWAVSAPDRTAIIFENDESTDVKWITQRVTAGNVSRGELL